MWPGPDQRGWPWRASLSKAGHEIIILNRDIKFGGLAEYGIFPAKLKLRGGLKKQYWELLERPNVHYFGNVSIGNGKDLTVEEVRNLGASAVVFSIGAQGTKGIGVEGGSAKGVFHAKDVVYHFNRLPGFGDRPFDMGKHVAIIGAGDVMVDICPLADSLQESRAGHRDRAAWACREKVQSERNSRRVRQHGCGRDRQ